MYLLDTNIVSELRRTRPHGGVLAWLNRVRASDLNISAVTVGEIQSGIEVTRAQDPAKAAELEAWLDRVAGSFNILPMDAVAFRIWAKLMHGRSDDLIEDAMIAATAQANGLTLVSRNTKDFAALGVPSLDPFSGHET